MTRDAAARQIEQAGATFVYREANGTLVYRFEQPTEAFSLARRLQTEGVRITSAARDVRLAP